MTPIQAFPGSALASGLHTAGIVPFGPTCRRLCVTAFRIDCNGIQWTWAKLSLALNLPKKQHYAKTFIIFLFVTYPRLFINIQITNTSSTAISYPPGTSAGAKLKKSIHLLTVRFAFSSSISACRMLFLTRLGQGFTFGGLLYVFFRSFERQRCVGVRIGNADGDIAA